MNNWVEELPEKCPPDNAFDPEGMTFYRLARTKPVSENDFLSHRKLHSNTVFKGVSECLAYSISIWDNLDKCVNILKLPRHKNKPKIVMQLDLQSRDGLVLQTFKVNHFSWWRTTSFDLNSVQVI
jgi:hypothetical protein